MGTWARNSTWKYIKCGKEADDLPATPPSGKITITENGTDIDVSTYATADVAVEGGGSSDFSTAEVTINVAEGLSVFLSLPFTVTIETPESVNYLGSFWTSNYSESTVNVVLYKGKAFGMILPSSDEVVAEVTGDIET